MSTAIADGPGYINVSRAERYFRTLVSAALLSAVLLGRPANPVLIFAFSLSAVYLMQTVLIAHDPVYALTRRWHLADRLQLWLETVATGALLPLVTFGDLVSSLTVFVLSSLGGLSATAAIMGKDAFHGLQAMGRRPLPPDVLSA